MISEGITFIGWIGVIVFAISGALVASRKEMDIVAFLFFGTVTGIGGGTMRDLVLGHVPVFWIKEPAYPAPPGNPPQWPQPWHSPCLPSPQ